MLEYILSETDRITRVKIALYNLDLWQIANRSFVIPESGFVRAEDGNPTSWGSLGFVHCSSLGDKANQVCVIQEGVFKA